MIRWPAALILLVLWAFPAVAQTVRVTSGEHGDFTRIVLEYPSAVDWRLGRTADGYRLQAGDGAGSYDLSGVYDLIGRSRLAAIWADPASGDLALSIACACHAIPFEFRPGTIVIDLRDGPPPEGSSFEEPVQGGAALPGLDAPPNPRPRSRPEPANPPSEKADRSETQSVDEARPTTDAGPAFRWTDLPQAQPTPGVGLGTALLDLNLNRSPGSASDLDSLRESLLKELGRGATQGIIEMAPPSSMDKEAAKPGAVPGESAPLHADVPVEIRPGDMTNLQIRQKGEAPESMSAQGITCIPDDRIAIVDWAAETPTADQMGPSMDGLVGEFDKPVAERIAATVRFHLHLGFGAEARSILRSFPVDHEDQAIWLTMADIIDGKPARTNAFAGMAACDTAASLWALLADPEVLALGQVEKAAVLRGFSALPRHLRHEFGPRLVERFLAMQDIVTATALRESVVRGTKEPTPEMQMMEAALEQAGGEPAASENRLSALADSQNHADPAVLAALVIQRAELGQTIGYDQVLALEAFLSEYGEGEERDKLELALTLAQAASGDFDAAFARLKDTHEAAATIWQLLARTGRDSPLLEHAVLPRDEALPKAARPEAALIAQRLVTLGLAEAAARWLSMEADPPPLLAARVALGLGQPERVLDILGGDSSGPAMELRSAALRILGDDAAFVKLAAEQGLDEEAWRAVSRMRDWPRLAADGPEGWKEAAQFLVGQSPGPDAEPGQAGLEVEVGELERDRNRLRDSEAMRSAISDLLEGLAAPDVATN